MHQNLVTTSPRYTKSHNFWEKQITCFSMKKKCCHVRMLSPNKSCSKDNLDRVIDVQQYNPLIHQQLRESKTQAAIACVASVCARVHLESWDKSKKKNEWRGRGRGKKETLGPKPHDFEKLRSPTNAASDWCGVGSVDYLALETSIKQGMLCLHASQIWSHLICGRRLQMVWTGIYFNCVCAKVYEIRVFKV